MTTAHHERSAIGAMYVGLGLTVVAMIVPYVDHATGNVLASHIRAGYPAYTQARPGAAHRPHQRLHPPCVITGQPGRGDQPGQFG